jgi:PD-(D/E)XK nuclease superfamily
MPQIIRTSDRQFFKRCRQLWDYTSKIRQNYEPLARIEALDFGTAIHAALENFYLPNTWGMIDLQKYNAKQAFLASIKEVEQKVRMGALEFEQTFEEQKTLGLAMLDYYFLYSKGHDDFKPLLVEVEFEVPIPGYEEAVYQGRIDLIVEDDKGYWLWDHKTTAQLAGTEWLALDDQCSSYAWALKKQLGLEVRGVVYNELRKKAPHAPAVLKNGTLSINKQQDTTYETYLATIKELGYKEEAYRPFLEYLKANPKEFVRRTKIRFAKDTLNIVEGRIQLEAREMLNDPAIYPTPSRFNCNGCRFFQPCIALHNGYDPSAILLENFEKRSSARTTA